MNLFPGPDPTAWQRREAIRLLDRHDEALRRAVRLRGQAGETLFMDLDQLWIRKTWTEALLEELATAELEALRHVTDVCGLLLAVRDENGIRERDDRLLERQQKAGIARA